MPTDYLSPKERATINSIAQRYSSNPSVPKIDPVLEADMEDISKLVATIVGGKGDGKTAIALLFPGTTYALSYDHKTERIAKQLIRAGLKKPNEIFVANPMKYRFGNVDVHNDPILSLIFALLISKASRRSYIEDPDRCQISHLYSLGVDGILEHPHELIMWDRTIRFGLKATKGIYY